jgi:LysR family transcriptional regulator, low CO2-responsive transcriptional regulator
LLEGFFQKLNVAPSVIMEIASIEAIKELVKLNLGVAVLAPWTVDRELRRGTLKTRPFGPQKLRRDWAIIHLSSRRLSLAEEMFCRLCRAQSAGLRLDRRDVG